MQKKILITGACGMIGSQIVRRLLDGGCAVVGIDRVPARLEDPAYTHLQLDLGDREALAGALAGCELTHIMHLAALAHTAGVDDLSWERYVYVNVTCAENVFAIAAERRIPILFASTADVYGIADGVVDGRSERRPIGNYGRSKCMAEDALLKTCADTPYTVMRFAPVYTPEVKRDIQKRYYLKYPKLAYRVGKGVEYEVLDINNLLAAVCGWVDDAEGQLILNVKDPELMRTSDIIREERLAGRAKFVLWVPRWIVVLMFRLLRLIMPMGWKTYMLNKIVNPLRTK